MKVNLLPTTEEASSTQIQWPSGRTLAETTIIDLPDAIKAAMEKAATSAVTTPVASTKAQQSPYDYSASMSSATLSASTAPFGSTSPPSVVLSGSTSLTMTAA
ncbi:hypothetical protein LR48_Vigan04g238600 [Vigna angularis]|uniref:Uncharacterized protein n=1 Tax=Phaseolus angularis TaxID=3914 RepID=A0A0L9UHE7_PHAAN|nr:hypothetical protein LR48_Vigan04g238600 [Vigna angularis]